MHCRTSESMVSEFAVFINPPEESIGSELLLTELIKTANSDTIDSDVLQCIKTGYSSYKAWVELLKHLEHFPKFSISDGHILHMNDSGDSALVIPEVFHKRVSEG